jgi:hypothetical protein
MIDLVEELRREDRCTARAVMQRAHEPGPAILAAVALLTAILAGGCASKAPKGVAEVPACRQAAEDVPKFDFDVGVDYLRRQAAAYSQCMEARGYALDQKQLDDDLKHFEMVKNADVMGGDPGPLIAVRRQKLRMSPALWHPPAPLNS